MTRPPNAARGKPAPAAPGVALRVEAARSLARIAFDGVSLRVALASAHARLSDPRDRALLAASVFAASRWWLRLSAALDRLMEKPLPPKAREIRALLVLGCAQIGVLDMPDYAVVAASVEAARALGQPQFAGLVNAVLRRYARERSSLNAALDADPVTRYAHPRWLIDAIARDWPDARDAILDAARDAFLEEGFAATSMSTIAAPTAIPVKPLSVMGVSMTRLSPNCSSIPSVTL